MDRVLRFGLLLLWLIVAGTALPAAAAEPPVERYTGLWNLTELKKVPQATWGKKSGPQIAYRQTKGDNRHAI